MSARRRPGDVPISILKGGDETPLRVLLLSPLEGLDPPSGDIAYTEALLADPPPGVQYTDYRAALVDGSLRRRGRRPDRDAFSLRDAGLLALRVGELAVRRSGLMFREPQWFISVRQGAYDLIHQHLFAVRQVGGALPVVSSAGYPLSVHYRAQDGWSARRARRAEALELTFVRFSRAHHPMLHPVPCGVMTVYTDHYREHLRRGGVVSERLLRCGTAIPDQAGAVGCGDGRTLGFVGRDFRRKGGDVALAAFRVLRDRFPELKLIVVTSSAERGRPELFGDGIEVLFDAPHGVVLEDVLRRTDVLLAPTESDCGVPYGILEALRAAVPVVVTDLPWLDERLVAPGAIRITPEVDAVANAVAALLDGATLSSAKRHALELSQSDFSMARLHADLLTAYRLAVGHR